ncbi:TetR family transcriptional regulator [Tamaricihabitans halophyticus]|uniref:TetR family transcriptional regulator n=1 Tax=Tamaricihabitans halophyticus TaxID=1262583 RepID=A0A4R2QFP8_9PSEU|nr:TetR/AcrR family transcriptional regulator [Tamaricihabitans halophyticus]TCP47970.1 TetR family transcriptional regulator [Tamaricihabitans halophyticus]
MTSKLGHREAKKLQTWRSLANAAFELAAERGLHEFHIEDVAERAGVSRRTFFNYFNRKEEAVVAVVDILVEDLLVEFEQEPADESLIDSVCRLASRAATGERGPRLAALHELSNRCPELRPYALGQRDRMVRSAHEVLIRLHPELQDTLYSWLLLNVAVTAAEAALEFGHTGQPLSQDDLRARLDEAFDYLRNGFRQPADRR